MARPTKLTAGSLKNELWETLQAIKSKQMTPAVANAVAAQSREIIRVVNTELRIAAMSGRKPSGQKMLGGN